MTFQIRQLILWPKKTDKPVRKVDFALNKVNVITGDSRTGKSAIIPIIDYCLASSDCLIPTDIIRDNVAWYGLLVSTGGPNYTLFARKEPDSNGRPSDVFVLKENISESDVPDQFDEKHDKVNGDHVKSHLNAIAHIPYVKRDTKNSFTSEHLSFRDVSHINLQAQEVMASQSVFFYKMNRGLYHAILSEWFCFLIGSEPEWRIAAQQELKVKKSLLNQKAASLKAMKEVADERVTQLKGLVATAKEFGFCCESSDIPDDRTTLLTIAQQVLDAGHTWEKSTPDTLAESERAYRKLMAEDDDLGTRIAQLQKRLADLAAFKEEFNEARSIAAERQDHLKIVEWFEKNALPASGKCPFCGSDTGHGEANEEMKKLSHQLVQYTAAARMPPRLPRAYEIEQQNMLDELNALLDRRRALRERFDVIRQNDEDARNSRHHAEEVYTLLGRINAELQYNRKVDDPDGLSREVDELQKQVNRLYARINSVNVQAETERILTKIGQLAAARMKTLDCDEKYTNTPPMFDPKNLNLILTDDQNRKMFLTQVGSASNWVSCHIAYTCALQEHFSKLAPEQSFVPSFMVYDQPSQVYFPKMQVSDDHQLEDKDRENVTKMFQTIADSIHDTEGKWQAIILEHAGRGIYQTLIDSGDLHEVEEWRNTAKLIPEDWL